MCEDFDECASDAFTCDENAICINTVGTFDCECKLGFYGDGQSCFTGRCPDFNCAKKGVHVNGTKHEPCRFVIRVVQHP